MVRPDPPPPSAPADHTEAPDAAPHGQARIVAIGASAGGLQALSVILAALPGAFPAPVVVVHHLPPDFRSWMAEILGRRTALRVKQAEEGDRIQAGWVYIAPPARHLLVRADGTLTLAETEKVRSSRPSVDVLFRSVAAAFGPGAIGLVLTGGDGDGADGVRAIKATGGVTLAQDQASSEHPSMPRAAAETGDVDHVLPLSAIGPALVTLLGNAAQ